MIAAAVAIMATALAVQGAVHRHASVGVQRRLLEQPGPSIGQMLRGRWVAWVASFGRDIDADQALAPAVASVVTLVIGGGVVAGLFGVAVAVGLLGIVVASGSVVARRRSDLLVDRALPSLLESVARSLRSGATLPAALNEARPSMPAPMAADLATIDGASSLGQPLVDALSQWSDRRPSRDVALAAAALAFTDDYGAAQARAMDGLAASFRARRQVEREITALASQAQVSAAVMSALPAGFVLVGLAAGSSSSAFLVGTTAGQFCLAVGVILDGAGLWWMRRIAAGVVH